MISYTGFGFRTRTPLHEMCISTSNTMATCGEESHSFFRTHTVEERLFHKGNIACCVPSDVQQFSNFILVYYTAVVNSIYKI